MLNNWQGDRQGDKSDRSARGNENVELPTSPYFKVTQTTTTMKKIMHQNNDGNLRLGG